MFILNFCFFTFAKQNKGMLKIKTWLKIGELFVDQENVRSISRFGNFTKICLMLGEDILVKEDYDKVIEMLPKIKLLRNKK